MLKNFRINISFLEAITDMPSYTKFLKDLLSKKWKLLENTTASLTEEYSVIIQNKLPSKLSDPGIFSIPCFIRDVPSVENHVILGIVWALCYTPSARSCK